MIPKDIGAHLTQKFGTAPALAAAGTRNSAAIDRQGFNSCVLTARSGAIAGAPTSQTLDAKLQDSADGSTGWADFVPGAAGSGAVAQITAANAISRKGIDLTKAKRFIRTAETVAFVGGTSPTIGACCDVTLGGADKEPPA